MTFDPKAYIKSLEEEKPFDPKAYIKSEGLDSFDEEIPDTGIAPTYGPHGIREIKPGRKPITVKQLTKNFEPIPLGVMKMEPDKAESLFQMYENQHL